MSSRFVLVALIEIVLVSLLFGNALPQETNEIRNKFMDRVEAVKSEIDSVTAMELAELLVDPESVCLIDRRTEAEFKAGHIRYANWSSRGMIEFDAMMGRIPGPTTPIVVYCQKDSRAVLSCKALKDLGYTNVRFLAGGFKAWMEAGMSVYNIHGEFKLVKFEARERDEPSTRGK